MLFLFGGGDGDERDMAAEDNLPVYTAYPVVPTYITIDGDTNGAGAAQTSPAAFSAV